MNKIIYIALGLFLITLSACEKELPGYSTDICRLNFVFYDPFSPDEKLTTEEVVVYPTVTEAMYSFIYEQKEIDTLWYEIETMGHLSSVDRPIKLVQIVTGENDAVAGKHYLSFDDEKLSDEYYYIPANESSVLVPIVVFRDASLQDNDVTLQFTFGENNYFKKGYPEFSTRTLVLSDKLAKPDNWESLLCDYYLGAYSTLKHQLMIDWTGERWDAEYLEQFMLGDQAYLTYMVSYLATRLAEENAKRNEQGLGNYQVDGEDIKFEY